MGLNVHGGGPVGCGWMESPRDGRWGIQNRGAQAGGSPEGTQPCRVSEHKKSCTSHRTCCRAANVLIKERLLDFHIK